MDVYNTVLDFSKELFNKFDGLIRVVALFGSRVKRTNREESDIDVLIIVDDLYNRWDDLVKTYYFNELKNLLNKDKFRKIHVTTVTLSVFWKMIKEGDPLVISILRNSIPILDSFGMLKALQVMLMKGEIKPSEEAIFSIKQRIPYYINMYHYHISKALEMAYWIFIESSQYLLMNLNINILDPSEIPKALEELKKKKLLKDIYIKWYKSIYELVHKIAHREIKEVSGEVVEEWFRRALDYKEYIENLVNKLKRKK